MINIGYSLIDGSNNEVDSSPSLPWSPAPPGNPLGRLATFTAAGQQAGGYRVVERWEDDSERLTSFHKPSTPGLPVWDGSKMVIARPYALPSAANMAIKVKAQIKQDAAELILGQFPEWKQRNMLAEGIALQNAFRKAGSLSTEQETKSDSLDAQWAWVFSVGEHSNALEAEIDGLLAGPGTDASKALQIAQWVAHDWPAVLP